MAKPSITSQQSHGLLLLLLIFAMLYRNLVSVTEIVSPVDKILLVDEENIVKEIVPETFEILCTAQRTMMKWGSFKIRCREFKIIAEHCAHVMVSIHPHKQILQAQTITLSDEAKRKSLLKSYSATISLKKALAPLPRLGRIFIDVVDDYILKSADLQPGNEVFVQSRYHGLDKFNYSKYHVVEHWYNSFPQDMLKGTHNPQFTIPTIQNVSTMQVATIWNNQGYPCPKMSSKHSDIVYSCIDKPFGVEVWYKDFVKTANSSEHERLENLAKDPTQGPGRIYYELFWKYHMLVVPAKIARREKLRYGNVQRAISQMRSGVPVLLEINGEIFQDFLIAHNYTCVYVMENALLPLEMTRQLWSFDEALQAMKSSEMRQKCQDEGLEIVKHYSPSTIVKKELRLLGYDDEFDCDKRRVI